MNKYQKALERIKKHCPTLFAEVVKDLATLQELVDKETPIKVTDIHVDEFYCPKCHSEITHDKYNSEHPKYCEECGQRLDWSDSE